MKRIAISCALLSAILLIVPLANSGSSATHSTNVSLQQKSSQANFFTNVLTDWRLSSMSVVCSNYNEAFGLASQQPTVRSFLQSHPHANLNQGHARVTIHGLCANSFSWISISNEKGDESILTVEIGSSQVVHEVIGSYPIFFNQFTRWSGWEAQYCVNWFFYCTGGTGVFYGADSDIYYVTGVGVPNPESPVCCAWSQWAGAGDAQGAGDGVLLQTGVSVNNGNLGNAIYGWYEALPGAAVIINSCTFRSGDQIGAYVDSEGQGHNPYNIELVDSTTGCAYFLDGYNYPALGSMTWAYYVSEAPVVTIGGTNYQTQVPTFGSAYMHGQMYDPNCGCVKNFDDNHNPISQDTMDLGCGYTNVQSTSVSNGAFNNNWQTSNVPGSGC